ncbi:MAG: ChbG/HpnK family deacetylase [Myxococcales bacterium]
MIRLVVNAQGFGIDRAGDRAIITAHREGIVTSASLAGNCPDLAGARTACADAPRLGVGLALALVGGAPVAPPHLIPTLVTAQGTLRATPADFALDWLKGGIVPDQVEHEMEAQLGRAVQAGFSIDHLCTRGHVGFLPGVGQLVERLARRHKIAGIRSSVEPPTLSWFTDPRRGVETGVLAGLSWLTRRRMGPLRHGPRTWGYVESGRLDEVRIIEIIGRLGPGSHELICYPAVGAGASADVDTESRALRSAKVKTALERRGILLCRWQDLF